MVCCDRCEAWFHPVCIGMAMSVYHDLVVAGDHSWFCHGCTDAAQQQQDGDTQKSVAEAEAEAEAGAAPAAPDPEENATLTAGSTVCTCERAYQGELVLRCSCCQRAYHPDCVGLRQWEDWSDWRCNRCPRYTTRRKTVGTTSDGHQGSTHSGGDRTHTCGQQGSVVIDHEAPADGTGALVAQPWASVGQLVTMAFEEPSTGAMEVRHWPGQITAIEAATGLLTIRFDDGCVETCVSPDDPDLNLQPQPEQHEPSRGSEGDIEANGTDAETSAETGGRTRGGSRPISLVLGKGKGSGTKPSTGPSSSDGRAISRVRLRLGPSPLAEHHRPGSPAGHKRPRLVMRPHTAAAASRGAAVPGTSTASKLRLVVGAPSPRRFRWTIGKRQPRRPLVLTVPARRVHRDQGRSGQAGSSRERHTAKSHATLAPAAAPTLVALEKEEEAPVVAHYCPVCLCDAEDPIMTPCSHWFCRDCLARAAKECGRRCPMCRRSLLGFARALLPEAGSRIGSAT